MTYQPHQNEETVTKPVASGIGASDPRYAEAVALVRKFGRPSISYVQRHMQIGYNRAFAMIDAMVGTVIDNMPPIGKVIPEAASAGVRVPGEGQR
jgi:DNA segregation ATPase FtsK/SpoIIIE-like protein